MTSGVVIVTSDSVNMASEACAAGKPVYVYDMPGGSPKFDRFHRAMRERGSTRRFEGVLENYTPVQFDDAANVVAALRRVAGARR